MVETIRVNLSIERVCEVSIQTLARRATSDCFSGRLWLFRDPRFESLSVLSQPATPACTATVFTSRQNWPLFRFLQRMLDTPTTDTRELGHRIIEGQHTLTLTQIEALARSADMGTAGGLRLDGYANYALTQTGDEADPVTVVRVDRRGREQRWTADMRDLNVRNPFAVGRRLVMRNGTALRID